MTAPVKPAHCLPSGPSMHLVSPMPASAMYSAPSRPDLQAARVVQVAREVLTDVAPPAATCASVERQPARAPGAKLAEASCGSLLVVSFWDVGSLGTGGPRLISTGTGPSPSLTRSSWSWSGSATGRSASASETTPRRQDHAARRRSTAQFATVTRRSTKSSPGWSRTYGAAGPRRARRALPPRRRLGWVPRADRPGAGA